MIGNFGPQPDFFFFLVNFLFFIFFKRRREMERGAEGEKET